MYLTKDMYLYILNFVENRDVINILSVNKKFICDANFKIIMRQRYPLLMKFKKKNTWKYLFVHTTYYINYLKNLEIQYIPSTSFNPKHFYLMYQKNKDIRYLLYRVLTILVDEGGHYQILQNLLNTMKKKLDIKIILNDLLCNTMKSADLRTIKILFENGATHYIELLYIAIFHNNFPIIRFAIENGLHTMEHDDFLDAINHAHTVGNIDIINYLSEYI